MDEKSYNEYLASYANSFRIVMPPQILNEALKNVNMEIAGVPYERLKEMVMRPKYFEHGLRDVSFNLYTKVQLYRNMIELWSSILTFDCEPIPYTRDGKPITMDDMNSLSYKKDMAIVKKFFDGFNLKREFSKVLWNMCMYDTYYTSIRTEESEGSRKMWLQELPADYSIIDAQAYMGYLYSFDVSYFISPGSNIDAYAPKFKKVFRQALELSKNNANYQPNYPNRHGRWVYWTPLLPDEAWVFKYHDQFAGSIPPLLGMMIDCAKMEKYKALEDAKAELEVYKVIVATVPRLTNNRGGNRTDNFAISAEQVREFVDMVKNSLKNGVDFKAAPLEDFKMFDFSPNASDEDLLATAITNVNNMGNLTSAMSLNGTINIASANLFKSIHGARMSKLYRQFEDFCAYQINKSTSRYKFKFNFLGTIWDKEDRIKQSNEDMHNGLILPSIFSSRGIPITDAATSMHMMYSMGMPEILKPIQMSSTMPSQSSDNTGGRPQKAENDLTDAGANTRTTDANNNT